MIILCLCALLHSKLIILLYSEMTFVTIVAAHIFYCPVAMLSPQQLLLTVGAGSGVDAG